MVALPSSSGHKGKKYLQGILTAGLSQSVVNAEVCKGGRLITKRIGILATGRSLLHKEPAPVASQSSLLIFGCSKQCDDLQHGE